ncbi:MAG TPA: prolipoprotein diacylglyceryl transferase family protein, partial [Oleiagrimonas sp.]|nr:prolipoprotein diacylglyceryl transferase family protein [Oleiagrimonas sp.]
LPWAMIYPHAHAEDAAYVVAHPAWQATFERFGGLPRQPSELYEALLEGVVMFVVLYVYSMKPRPRYAVSGLFALMYGCFRFAIEFVRLPDAQLGYLAWGWVTMGQILSLPLIIIGLALLWMSRRAPTLPVVASTAEDEA